MPQKKVTIERIDRALALVAEAIETHPDLDMWDFFDLVEKARENHLSREDRLSAAINRVKQN